MVLVMVFWFYFWFLVLWFYVVLGLVWFGFLTNWMLLVLDLFLYIFLFPNLPLKIKFLFVSSYLLGPTDHRRIYADFSYVLILARIYDDFSLLSCLENQPILAGFLAWNQMLILARIYVDLA